VAAVSLYALGKPLTARDRLIGLLDDASVTDPQLRAKAFDSLLTVCERISDGGCMVAALNKYSKDVLDGIPVQDGVVRSDYARLITHYANYAEWLTNQPILGPDFGGAASWRYPTIDGALYVDHWGLVAAVRASQDDLAGADAAVDRELSYIASVRNPSQNRHMIALALSGVVETLADIGETERAYGVYRATGAFVLSNLPAVSLENAWFRYVEASLLEELGDLKGARNALDLSLSILGKVEIDPATRDYRTGLDLTLKSVVCAALGDLDGAQAAIAQHPYSKRFNTAGRAARSYAEVTYLAARAYVQAASGHPDPLVGPAVAEPLSTAPTSRIGRREAVYRKLAQALSLPPGAGRDTGLAEAGALEAEAAKALPPASFGAWPRLGFIDAAVTALALGRIGQGPLGDDETVFELFQLAKRGGASFDADALTALARGRTDDERRAIHEALRLRARRDELERQALQEVVNDAAVASPIGGALTHDVVKRARLRDLSLHVSQLGDELAERDIPVSGANIVALEDFQAKLRLGEAALAVTPAVGGAAYLCVRRDTIFKTVAPADWKQANLDGRILMDALTSSNPPSDELDAQFPVAASMRLYDLLIRPFGECLKPGDSIIWLPGLSLAPAPLAALLDAAPPKLGDGYDLSKAHWLAREHAISYAGSASVIAAARIARRRAVDFDFLGVGDPHLTGATATGEDRQAILGKARGGAAPLAPLPDTKPELEDAARGFGSSAKLLLEGDATKGAFRRELVGSYRYISFATHGLSGEDPQGLSDPALVLTPESASDERDNGLLTASEIADLDLSADFVALSACDTALYDPARLPEDLPALSSAFAVAGAPATLATQWSVDSATTRRIVGGVFAKLAARASRGPAEDLAAAQRDFLAKPPGRAFLHPRFWAAFLVLGDGGPPAAAEVPTPLEVDDVEPLSYGSAVLAAKRHGHQTIASTAQFPEGGGEASAIALLASRRSASRWARPQIAASSFLASLGPTIVVGGRQSPSGGAWRAAIEFFDRGSGRLLSTWSAPTSERTLSTVSGGAQVGGREAVFVVAELLGEPFVDRRSALHVYSLKTGQAAPQLLFDDPLPGVNVTDATIAVSPTQLILTYSDRLRPPPPAASVADDYDATVCAYNPRTWVELRDRASGRLVSRTAFDRVVVTSTTTAGGHVFIAGAALDAKLCQEKAAIWALDPAQGVRTVFRDPTMGSSELRSLSANSAGLICAGGADSSSLDFDNAATSSTAELDRNRQTNQRQSGLIACAQGAQSVARTLDGGGDVSITAVDASDGRDIWAGGSAGGQAVLLRLSAPETRSFARPAPASRHLGQRQSP
jgi:CHAT domain-containing protein/tetratricopeptide (TPR) repeat protein